jgi:excisionase family DNA binding protein
MLYPQTATIDEACDFLRCSRATLYRLMRSGELPYSTVFGRRRILLEAIEAYLLRTDNRRQQTA